ncbi:MAG TPA: condensation domain-containing protein [Pseudonocardiaceae bacterium]|nr:condensation domain-containing protein [Pseudonocardiaceae bacterium]
MTHEQEAVWLADHLDDGPSRYLESWAYRLSGRLDSDAVRWAVGRLVDRHEPLRTWLTVDADRPVQVVLPGHDPPIECRTCPAATMDAVLSETVSRPLDLRHSPLRVVLLRLAPDDTVLVIQFHHAAIDDWALAVFGQEFGEFYRSRVTGSPPHLEPLPLQLGEYALVQRSASVAPGVLAYWRRRLTDFPKKNSPPPDHLRPATPSHLGGQVQFRIDAEVAELVRATCRARRTTPFTVHAAALTALLCHYNGTTEAILGTPVSHRDAALDHLVGCLTDLLPLRLAVRDIDSFADLVTSTRTVVWEAVANKAIPYTALISRAVARRELGTLPLCQTVLVMDDAGGPPFTLPDVTAERLYPHSGMAKFDLCVTLVTDGGGYRGFLEYARDLFTQQTAERIAADLRAVLATALRLPDRPLSEVLTRAVPDPRRYVDAR